MADALAKLPKLLFDQLFSSDVELNQLIESVERIHAKNAGLSYTQMPSDWLDELTSGFYEAEDIIDSVALAVAESNPIRFPRISSARVRDLRAKLEEMDAKISSWQTKQRLLPRPQVRVSEADFRREKDKEVIIAALKSRPFGVSITGMCGVGKTTLLEAIAEDVSIKSHFPRILSPRVSRGFDSEQAVVDLDAEQPRGDERVLILLDDLRIETPEDWQHFWSHCKQRLDLESKVLITTRDPRVAHVTGSTTHTLNILSGEECFDLILKGAKANKNLCEDDLVAMMNNKNELAEKCKGLPLLANHIGLLLSSAAPGSRIETIRTMTARSLWKLPEFERVLVSLASVSLALQPRLRRCLAYCSLFPPMHGFKKVDLVELWMAEGFVRAKRATKDTRHLERIASGYFDDFVSHAIFRPSESIPDEEPSYEMSRLLYDLAQDVASKTCCRMHILESTPVTLESGTRHISLSCDNVQDVESIVLQLLNDVRTCSGLRTFLLLNRAGEKISKNPTFFESLDRLRVLDLSHANVTRLSNVSKLKHLRCLDLSHTPIKTLPSLSRNKALQVLKLKCCDNLRCLPNDISKLIGLTCLEVNMKGLAETPPSIGSLRNLRSLNVFVVKNADGRRITELRNMNDLRKSLCITKLENVKDRSSAEQANLRNKNELERLELQWSFLTADEDAKQVLEALRPPKNLRELTIRSYGGYEFPQWLSTVDICGMLVAVHLDRCSTCRALPSFWKLPKLKKLRVDAMPKLIHVREGHRFPALEELVLSDLPELVEWTEMEMPRLRDLQIVKCGKLAILPPMDRLSSLETLQIIGCANLKQLPILPSNLKSMIIEGCDFVKQHCRDEQPDWTKFDGIKVLIDSELVDTSNAHFTAPDADQQSSSDRIFDIVNNQDIARHQLQHKPCVLNARKSGDPQISEKHPHRLPEMHDQGRELLQGKTLQHRFPGSQLQLLSRWPKRKRPDP